MECPYLPTPVTAALGASSKPQEAEAPRKSQGMRVVDPAGKDPYAWVGWGWRAGQSTMVNGLGVPVELKEA